MMIHGVTADGSARHDDRLYGTDGKDVLFGGLDRSIYYDKSSLTELQVREALAPFHDRFINGIPSVDPRENIAGYTEEEWGEFVERTVYTTSTDWTAPFGDVPASPPGNTNEWYEEDYNIAGYPYSDFQTHHPGADQDFRRVVGTVELGDTGQTATYGQQATYDDGRLITHGPGAGTPDLQAPGRLSDLNLNVGDHKAWDVLPSEILGWELYHRLGWTPHREWPSHEATEYWGQDGNDTLEGGSGNDTYGFIVGGGSDTISDIGNIGDKEDTLEIYGGGPIDNIWEDISFSLNDAGNSLIIGIAGATDNVTVSAMNNPATQVEKLALVRGDETIEETSLTDIYYEKLNPVKPDQLVNTSWSISAIDDADNTFDGSKLYFTEQTPDADGSSGYDVKGSFDWKVSAGPAAGSYGKETFIGELEGYDLTLVGQDIGQPDQGLVTATYTGTLSDDGYEIENGHWSGGGAIPGEWSAILTDPLPFG